MDLEFQSTDFERLMFRIDEMNDNVDPVKHFPRLQKWPEFAPKGKGWSIVIKNKIFRWIVLMYDKESPFRAKIDDPMKRKLEVAKYVKLIKNFTVIDPEVKEIIRGENGNVNKMIVAYIRMHRNSQYALVVGLENMFMRIYLRFRTGKLPENK